ncbi:hypothetical protein J4482_00115 [Candidatus Woesearchaeota archaeon]|nr:hypothetical protein [Candidatus Woesearchaeota archaeon]
MKIREVQDKKIGNKEYKKYLITLPKKIVEDSKLIGKELKASLDKEKIIIEKEN